MLTPIFVILSLAYAAICWFGYMPRFLRPYASDDPKKGQGKRDEERKDGGH